MTTEDAKAYLACREIPQLFESLMTGLMFYRPEDHIIYLQECLKKIRDDGVDKVRWNLFIESKRKTPLPPITPDGRARTPKGSRESSFITDGPKSLEAQRGSPLPPIGQSFAAHGGATGSMAPNCPVILALGGPGSGKATQCELIKERYAGFVHLSMGDLLRQNIMKKGDADDKWEMISKLVNKGDMAPEDVTVDLIKEQLNLHKNAKGIIIEGYPRTMEQLEEFKQLIGRVDLAFVLDCEEQYLSARLLARGAETGRVDDNINAVASRITYFKDKTLPVIKHLDDLGKLAIVSGELDGDRDKHVVFYELAAVMDSVFGAPNASGELASAPLAEGAAAVPRPPSSPRPRGGSRPGSAARLGSRQGSRPGSGFTRVPTMIDLKEPDTGRKTGLPTCPMVLVVAGPGCGKGKYCQRFVAHNTDFAYVSVGKELVKAADTNENVKNAIACGDLVSLDIVTDVLRDSLSKISSSTKGILLDGFPRTKEQIEYFNSKIGGLEFAVLIDFDEKVMNSACDASAEVKAKKIKSYKHNVLPILGYMDDTGKLAVVNGDQTGDQIFDDFATCVHQNLQTGAAEASANASTMFTQRPPSARIDPPDTGRKSGLPTCPFIAIVGSPGAGVDIYSKKVAEKYPNFAHLQLTGKGTAELKEMAGSLGSKEGALLEAFPPSQRAVYEFNKNIGGLDGVIVLDCDEAVAVQNGSQDEIDQYKYDMLPLLGYYDDRKRLEVISLAQYPAPQDVVEAVCKAIENIKAMPKHDCGGASGDAYSISVNVADTGRKSGLATCPIIAIAGSSGSGREQFCKDLTQKYDKSTHMNAADMSGEALAAALPADASVVFVEGFPKDKAQLEQFNTAVGGMSGVIVLDTTEEFAKSKGGDASAITDYQKNTLPVLGHYDDCSRLQVIKAEQDSAQVLADICKAVDEIKSSKVS